MSLYLDLLRKCLLNTIYEDPAMDPWSKGYDPVKRAGGRDWPSQAHTMIGEKRLKNLEECCIDVLCDSVPGDFVETGAWRGGACILMRGLLEVIDDGQDRKVWVCDSFEGLPKPERKEDAGDQHHTFKQLAVSLEEVQENFRKYNLLDDRVIFLKGWFKDTLPAAPIDKIAVLRLDGDMFGSTMDAFQALYPKVSRGGYVIVDDYYAVAGCRNAITECREMFGITDPIQEIDGMGVYWRVT